MVCRGVLSISCHNVQSRQIFFCNIQSILECIWLKINRMSFYAQVQQGRIAILRFLKMQGVGCRVTIGSKYQHRVGSCIGHTSMHSLLFHALAILHSRQRATSCNRYGIMFHCWLIRYQLNTINQNSFQRTIIRELRVKCKVVLCFVFIFYYVDCQRVTIAEGGDLLSFQGVASHCWECSLIVQCIVIFIRCKSFQRYTVNVYLLQQCLILGKSTFKINGIYVTLCAIWLHTNLRLTCCVWCSNSHLLSLFFIHCNHRASCFGEGVGICKCLWIKSF